MNKSIYLYTYSKRPHAMGTNLIKGNPEIPKNNQPALVFVHGAWHGAWCWQEHFFPFFTKNGYECYTFDLPNHGVQKDQKGINQYRIKDYLNHLELVLAEINKPVILIGHSMGGYIVQKYLENKDCKAAILIAPVPCKPIWRLFFKLLRNQPLNMLKMIGTFDLFQLVNTKEKAAHLLFSDKLSTAKIEEYTQKLGSESFSLMVFDFLLSSIKQRKNLTIPMLVQGAGKDKVVSLEETKYTRRFQQADYQFFKGIAHDVMVDPNWLIAAKGMLKWVETKFPVAQEEKAIITKKPTVKMQFPDAVQDLIINLGENNEIDANKTKILGLGKSKRDN